MEDLIFKFLLQSGYTRACIVSDVKTVHATADGSQASFIIVDPDNTDAVAVIKVVGAVTGDGLQEQGALSNKLASQLGGAQVQAFVIRVDPSGRNEAEQVQFYRTWPNKAIQQLSASTFPDLGALLVHHKLNAPKNVPSTEKSVSLPEESITDPERLGKGAYIPAILLLLVAAVDWYMSRTTGTGILGVTHALLLVGSGLLLSWPALVRYAGSSR